MQQTERSSEGLYEMKGFYGPKEQKEEGIGDKRAGGYSRATFL